MQRKLCKNNILNQFKPSQNETKYYSCLRSLLLTKRAKTSIFGQNGKTLGQLRRDFSQPQQPTNTKICHLQWTPEQLIRCFFIRRWNIVFRVSAVLNRGLLLTVTDISTTCVEVILKVEVSWITSINGIKLWLLTWLVNYVAMLLVVFQLSCDVIGYEDSKCEPGAF